MKLFSPSRSTLCLPTSCAVLLLSATGCSTDNDANGGTGAGGVGGAGAVSTDPAYRACRSRGVVDRVAVYFADSGQNVCFRLTLSATRVGGTSLSSISAPAPWTVQDAVVSNRLDDCLPGSAPQGTTAIASGGQGSVAWSGGAAEPGAVDVRVGLTFPKEGEWPWTPERTELEATNVPVVDGCGG